MTSVTQTVRDSYAAVARSGLSNDSAAARSVAVAFGYSEEELSSLSMEANRGNTETAINNAMPVHNGLVQVLLNCDANAYAAKVRVYATVNPHNVSLEHTDAPEKRVSPEAYNRKCPP